ncbi:Fe-S cluster assembly protein SufD [bacterium]|nr:Fe-S cluster assembly protein SufD [bacterium]
MSLATEAGIKIMREALDRKTFLEQLAQTAQQLADNLQETAEQKLRRLKELEALTKLHWPTAQDEIWRYTGPELFPFDNFTISAEQIAKSLTISNADPAHIKLINSGAELDSFIKRACEREANSQLAATFALHRTFCTTRNLIQVQGQARGVTAIEHRTPYSSTHNQAQLQQANSLFPHTIISVSKTSQATIVQDFAATQTDRQTADRQAVDPFLMPVTDIFVADGATLRYIEVQDLPTNVKICGRTRVWLGRDANFYGFQINTGAKVARFDYDCWIEGPGANAEMLGLYLSDGKQHFDVHTGQRHKAPQARSNLLFKGALGGKSRSIFAGTIIVDPGAQKTDAYQTNRNLLLSSKAKADSIPGLEISADDVKCSHGSSTGHDATNEIFYMRSRGLTELQARKLLVRGFFEDLFDLAVKNGMPQTVLDRMHALVDAKLSKIT